MLAGELTVRQISSPVTLAVESVEPAGAGFRATLPPASTGTLSS